MPAPGVTPLRSRSRPGVHEAPLLAHTVARVGTPAPGKKSEAGSGATGGRLVAFRGSQRRVAALSSCPARETARPGQRNSPARSAPTPPRSLPPLPSPGWGRSAHPPFGSSRSEPAGGAGRRGAPSSPQTVCRLGEVEPLAVPWDGSCNCPATSPRTGDPPGRLPLSREEQRAAPDTRREGLATRQEETGERRAGPTTLCSQAEPRVRMAHSSHCGSQAGADASSPRASCAPPWKQSAMPGGQRGGVFHACKI